jgi:hypothetical protein
VDTFGKSSSESDLNYKTSSFSIQQLRNYTDFPCNDSHTLELRTKGNQTKTANMELYIWSTKTPAE